MLQEAVLTGIVSHSTPQVLWNSLGALLRLYYERALEDKAIIFAGVIDELLAPKKSLAEELTGKLKDELSQGWDVEVPK